MSTQEPKPIPSVELSLKYASWNVKSIDESMKMLVTIAKTSNEALNRIANALEGCKQNKRIDITQHTHSSQDEVPF